jgi:hypothetical protein
MPISTTAATRRQISRRDLVRGAAGLAAAVALPGFAQTDKSIRFILPNATGSGVPTS